MEGQTFKVLSFGNNIFVDELLLSKGLYSTDIPRLYSTFITMESLINRAEDLNANFPDGGLICEEYFDNLKRCKLVEVTLTINN